MSAAVFLATLGGARVSLASASDTISDITVVVDAGAALELQNDGDIIEATNNFGSSDVGDWITPKAAAGSNYEVRVTVNSGALSTGTSGSWLSLGTTRSWSVTQSGAGSSSAEILVEIRRASGATLASKTITLSASVGA